MTNFWYVSYGLFCHLDQLSWQLPMMLVSSIIGNNWMQWINFHYNWCFRPYCSSAQWRDEESQVLCRYATEITVCWTLWWWRFSSQWAVPFTSLWRWLPFRLQPDATDAGSSYEICRGICQVLSPPANWPGVEIRSIAILWGSKYDCWIWQRSLVQKFMI